MLRFILIVCVLFCVCFDVCAQSGFRRLLQATVTKLPLTPVTLRPFLQEASNVLAVSEPQEDFCVPELFHMVRSSIHAGPYRVEWQHAFQNIGLYQDWMKVVHQSLPFMRELSTDHFILTGERIVGTGVDPGDAFKISYQRQLLERIGDKKLKAAFSAKISRLFLNGRFPFAQNYQDFFRSFDWTDVSATALSDFLLSQTMMVKPYIVEQDYYLLLSLLKKRPHDEFNESVFYKVLLVLSYLKSKDPTHSIFSNYFDSFQKMHGQQAFHGGRISSSEIDFFQILQPFLMKHLGASLSTQYWIDSLVTHVDGFAILPGRIVIIPFDGPMHYDVCPARLNVATEFQNRLMTSLGLPFLRIQADQWWKIPVPNRPLFVRQNIVPAITGEIPIIPPPE